MTFSQVSPGQEIKEIDLATIIPSVSSTEAAIASMFRWGPLNTRVLVSNEIELAKNFLSPNANNYARFLTAASFLAYSNALYVTRVGTEASIKNSTCSNSSGFLVKNDDQYEATYSSGINSVGEWVARHPGVIGNSLKVSICPRPDAYQRTLTGTMTVTANTTTVTGVGTKFATQVAAGDYLVLNSEIRQVSSVTNATSLVLSTKHVAGAAGANTAVKRWEYFNNVPNGPRTSAFANTAGGFLDELHVVVADEDGLFTGEPGTVLEVWPNLSMASDAIGEDGASTYYKNVINQRSKYIRWAAHSSGLTNAGTAASGTTYGGTANNNIRKSLIGGKDGGQASDADLIRGYNLYAEKNDVDVSFIIAGDASQTLATHLINNVAENRKDCLVCLSPRYADVVNNSGSEANSIVTYRNLLPSTSFAVMDSGWKYMYDKYNDVYRWVPLNGDIAGCMVRTDNERDPWFSPAGQARGQIKNSIKLSYNPSKKTERDLIYKSNVNPVVTSPGRGTMLYGDKTLLNTPSAFDRINVRRLFIVLQKAISRASEAQLFELNDEFTRAQFVNLVEPFLRDVQGRRGIYDFRVVCDSTNNPAVVIDNNEFVGDIYIKPARSINYMTLNFIAARTGVDFNEIIGKF